MTQAAPQQKKTSRFGERFGFGGVEFEILAGETFRLAPEYAGCVGCGPVAAQIRCSLHRPRTIASEPVADSLPSNSFDRSGGAPVCCEWLDGDNARVRTLGMTAQLRRLRGGMYAAVAHSERPYDDGSAVVSALSAAAVEREGGAVLHAAGIELDGAVVLLIGPSGAGKTTACNQARGASWFVRDRAMVVASPRGPFVWSLPGGSDRDHQLPRSAMNCLPLAGVLRVRQGDRHAIHRLSLSQSVAAMRESMLAPTSDPCAESARIEALTKLIGGATTNDARCGGHVPFGEVHVKLGEPITDVIKNWIQHQQPVNA